MSLPSLLVDAIATNLLELAQPWPPGGTGFSVKIWVMYVYVGNGVIVLEWRPKRPVLVTIIL
jgi:hypothetical protein